MKGLEVNIIGMLVLAIVSILLLILLVTKTIQPLGYRIYCDVYLKIVSYFSHVEPSSIPAYCKANAQPEISVVEIRDGDNKVFSRQLLSYIIGCWQETEIKELYTNHTCYELDLFVPVDKVTEFNVTQVLNKEDQCKSIENSDYGCGVLDQIDWQIGDGTIENQKIILIEYVNDTDSIRVVG